MNIEEQLRITARKTVSGWIDAKPYQLDVAHEAELQAAVYAALNGVAERMSKALNLALDSYQKTLDGLAAEYNFQSADVRTEHDYGIFTIDEELRDEREAAERMSRAITEFRAYLGNEEDCDQDTDGTWRPNAAMSHLMEFNRLLEKHEVELH